ncbi:ComEC/Rec2 family competence protein [Nonomuraea maritima]|uniref:ComEC/Rec2 family competence protein n=1 Tax=Nonomuraea maritima TaxID=683260 RepID=UPI001C40B528|nr:ComEC/Rec2 family competence protein [Nonomuraea maritima]
MPALAAWAAAMVLLGCPAGTGAIAAITAALGAAATAWLIRPRVTRIGWYDITSHWRNIAIATLICTAAASVSVALRVHMITSGPVPEMAGENAYVTAQITLTDDPKRRPNGGGHFNQESYVTPAALKIVQTATSRQAVNVPVTVFATGRVWGGFLPSQHLEVTGRLARPTTGGTVAAILLVRGPPKVLTPPSVLQTAAGTVRAGLRSAADVLPPEQRGLLPGLVVGDVSRMDQQVTSDMREAGLSHLNAVSGANLAIVAGATLALSRVIGLPLPVRAGFAAVAMVLFAVVARPSPSVLRALLMGLVAALAMGTGRTKDGVAALSATVLLLILFVPELARSYGFALSVTATAGILLLAPRWRDKMSRAEDPTPDERTPVPGGAPITSGERGPAPVEAPITGSWTPAPGGAPTTSGIWTPVPAGAPIDSGARTPVPARGPTTFGVRTPVPQWSSTTRDRRTEAIQPAPFGNPGHRDQQALNADCPAVSGSYERTNPFPHADHHLPRGGIERHDRPSAGHDGLTGGKERDARLLGDRDDHPAPEHDGQAPDGRGDQPAVGGRQERQTSQACSRSSVLGRLPPLPRWAAEAVAVPAAAQVAVTPVLVLMAGELTPVAVIANLLVAPAVAPATLLGFAAALISPLWVDGARLLVIPAGYAVGWIITVARWAANLPFATVPWPAGLPGLALLLLAAVVAIPILRRRAWRAVVATLVVAALVVVLVIRPIVVPWPPKGWLMVMCDVGQGDGLIVAAGPGRAVVVDTGPDPAVMDKCLRRVGIVEVPLVILTHPHADHVDGLPGVLRGRRVGAVVVSPHRPEEGSGIRTSALLAQHRIPEWTVTPGARWRFGPSELTVLAPDRDSGASHGYGEGSETNNASVVIHVRWRSGSALLGGDLETEAQDELLNRYPTRADILKVPHHGSHRQSPEFLRSFGARAALISVGADNEYGHPAPSTLGVLRGLGLAVYRTDQSGDVAVVERQDGMAVVVRGR